MDVKLLKLQEADNVKKLQSYVESLDIDDICSELKRISRMENGSVILLILLKGLPDSYTNEEKKMRILREMLNIIKVKSIAPKLAQKLVNVLGMQIESFSSDNIITLIDYCLQMMKEDSGNDGGSCWKDLIPKLLNKIMEEDYIDHNGSSMKGTEYKNDIVTAMCVSEWSDNIVTNVASMFVDISLTQEEHLKVVNKLCKSMLNAHIQEVPPLVHQLLQLTKEQHFMPVFLSLVELFDKNIYSHITDNDRGVQQKEIQTVEGTVLYHIYSFVSSLGPPSVRDFLKTLKECVNSPGFILTPFTVTLLMNISCVSYTLEEEILGVVKSAIMRNFAEEERVSDSAWLASVVPDGVRVDDLFDKIIKNCSRDRDKVLKGLVNLSFLLLSVHKLRGREFQSERAWNLGNSILLKIINKYGDLTGFILQELANQISQVHESTQYTDFLFHVVRKNPLNVVECSSVMIQLLDTICGRLSASVGRRVVAVILPLTKMSQSLRDSLIIVLRKSLFPRDIASRQMAVSGILELLKDLRISNLQSLSQSISQQYCGLTQIYSEASADQGPSHSNEGLCLELLSILREVFKHQHEVKTVFYRGLYESVYVNPELGCHALDSLQNQFDQFYIPGDDIPPLNFEKTVSLQGNKPILLEPLAQLMLSMGLILAKVEESSSKCSKLREMFTSLCQRMSDSDIPHFILGKEPLDGSPEGAAKEEEIRQILGVYEALMGYVVCTWTKETFTHGDMLNSLFKGFGRLSDYARSLGKPDRKDKGKNSEDKRKEKNKTGPFRFPTTVFNFKCSCRLLSLLYEDAVTWAPEQSVGMIKNKRELHRYCLNGTLALLKQAQNITGTELSKNSATLRYLTKIGRILFTKCVKRVGTMKEFDRTSTVLALECFAELIQLVLTNFEMKFPDFLTDISDCVDKELNAKLKAVLTDLLDELNEILRDDFEDEAKEEEVQIRKTSILLVTICTTLASELRRGPEAMEVMDKTKKMCKEIKIESPTVAKSVLTFLLTLYAKSKTGSLMTDLALCLCDSIPLIDCEMKVVDHTNYAIINTKSANSCLTAVCDALRAQMNQIDWAVARFKSELLIMSQLPKNHEKLEDLYERERLMCQQITSCMRVLSLLSTVAIPPGVYADSVLKELSNFYNKITTVTKYFITKVGKYNQQLQISRYDKTVKLVEEELSKNMYCFTEHVIAEGTSGIDTSKKDPTFLKNKSLRETKIIPKVIFEKEQFEKFVMQLSNKAKVNLVCQTRYARARDYRLYAKPVRDLLEKENVQYEEMDTDESQKTEDDADSEDSNSKRARLEDL